MAGFRRRRNDLAAQQDATGKTRGRGPRQQVELLVAAEIRPVGKKIYAALVALPATVTGNSKATLEARTGAGWRSFGEVITVQLASVPGGTRVRIASRPKVPTTLIDYGSGRRRVDAVVEALRTSFPLR